MGLKGGSVEGMVITALGIQTIYFTSMIDFTFAKNFQGFMQFLRFTRFELDYIPNVFTEYLINEGSRTEYLIRTNDMKFYKISNMLEFNSIKLMILFIYSLIFISLSSSLLCCKKRRSGIKRKLEAMTYKGFIIIFMVLFAPFGFS